MKFVAFFTLAFISTCAKAQGNDTLPYNLYRDQIIVYSDLGFNSAPFTIKGDYLDGVKKVQFKHNQKVTMGFGIAYKWFALRIGFALPDNLRPVSRFGPANYRDLGVSFNIKKTYWDIDIRDYEGYAIKNAYKWNDTLSALKPNSLMQGTRSINFSIHSWFLKSKNFKMSAVKGITGDYKDSQGTWFFKSTFNIFGSGNDTIPLLPSEIVDPNKNIYNANSFFALDFGVVPGYAYVHRWKNLQASAFGGLGGVVQVKSYVENGLTRGFLGLAPRIDLRFNVGYSEPHYFIWLQTNFDIKSIRFKEVSYRQLYYSMQLVGGYRFNKKEKNRK